MIAVVAVVVILVVVGGYLGATYLGSQSPASPTPTPAPQVAVQETARNSAMQYIAANHTDIASLTTNLTWAGGRQDTGLVGAEKYVYTAGNWNVTITNPVIPDPTYTVNAVYTDTVNKVTIEWEGTYKNGVTAETKFNYIVP